MSGVFPQPPEKLLRCDIEDWVSPGQIAAVASLTPPGESAESHWSLWAAARFRHSRARKAWFVTHQVPAAAQAALIPVGKPRWRDTPPQSRLELRSTRG